MKNEVLSLSNNFCTLKWIDKTMNNRLTRSRFGGWFIKTALTVRMSFSPVQISFQKEGKTIDFLRSNVDLLSTKLFALF